MLRAILLFIRDLVVLIGFCLIAAACILGSMVIVAGWDQ